MAVRKNINLLKVRQQLSPQFVAYETHLRRAAIGFFSISLVLGILSGAGYFVSKFQVDNYVNTKNQLLADIASQQQKEALLVSVRQRIGLVSKIFPTQLPWDEAISTVLSVAQPPELTTLTVDDKQRIQMVIKLNSVDEAVGAVAKIMQLTSEKKIRSPQLTSLILNKDASVELSVAVLPVFKL